MKWTNFKQRLPPDGENVLMINENGRMAVGSIIDCGDYIRLKFGDTSKAFDFWNIKVTYWAPLPESPEVK